MVYHELGRHPLICNRLSKIFKYWSKLRTTDNEILQACYNQMFTDCTNRANCSNWLANVKTKLFELGLGNLWTNQKEVNTPHSLLVCKTRVLDQSLQAMKTSFSSSKFLLYRNIITPDHCLQMYF